MLIFVIFASNQSTFSITSEFKWVRRSIYLLFFPSKMNWQAKPSKCCGWFCSCFKSFAHKISQKLQKTNIKNCAHICKIAIEKLYRIDIFYYIKYTVNVLTLAHHQQPENTKTFDFDSSLQTQNICRVNKLPSILYFWINCSMIVTNLFTTYCIKNIVS